MSLLTGHRLCWRLPIAEHRIAAILYLHSISIIYVIVLSIYIQYIYINLAQGWAVTTYDLRTRPSRIATTDPEMIRAPSTLRGCTGSFGVTTRCKTNAASRFTERIALAGPTRSMERPTVRSICARKAALPPKIITGSATESGKCQARPRRGIAQLASTACRIQKDVGAVWGKLGCDMWGKSGRERKTSCPIAWYTSTTVQ